MAPARRQLRQRQQDESALLEPWMGQDRPALALLDLVIIRQKVKIEHPRLVALAAQTPEMRLDPMQQREQFGRAQIRFHRYHRIDEPGLVRDRHRGGAIKMRAAQDRDAPRRQLGQRRFERDPRRPIGAWHIGPQSDEDHGIRPHFVLRERPRAWFRDEYRRERAPDANLGTLFGPWPRFMERSK